MGDGEAEEGGQRPRYELLASWFDTHNRIPLWQHDRGSSPDEVLEQQMARILSHLRSLVKEGRSTPALEHIRGKAPQLLTQTSMAEKAERYVALWKQRGGLPKGPPADGTDEGGKEAWNFLVGRRRDYPSTGDPQAYAILDAAFPGWCITRKRKTVLASVTGENE